MIMKVRELIHSKMKDRAEGKEQTFKDLVVFYKDRFKTAQRIVDALIESDLTLTELKRDLVSFKAYLNPLVAVNEVEQKVVSQENAKFDKLITDAKEADDAKRDAKQPSGGKESSSRNRGFAQSKK